MDQEEKTKEKNSINGLTRFLMILAVLTFISSFIVGIVLAIKEVPDSVYEYGYFRKTTKHEFDFVTAVMYWCAGLFLGTLMLAVAEIVEQLIRQTTLLKNWLKRNKLMHGGSV